MKNTLTTLCILLFTLFLISCQNEKVNIPKTMKNKVKKHLEDQAFKKNATIEFYEFDLIEYRPVTQKRFDSIRWSFIRTEINYFSKMSRNKSEIANNYAESAKLYAVLGSKTLMDMKKEDGLKTLDEAIAYNDSAKYYLRLDTIIQKRLDSLSN